jgi:PAS domain S-box-containing protein
MLGYGEEEIENRYEEWESRVHPEDLPKALKAVEDLLSNRVELYHCEHRLRCKDGSYRWILDRGKVMEWDSEGKPLRAVGTHTDITEQKETEERIRHLLQEKELLLRETHHRILNNLSVIRSLLSLQAAEVSAPEAVESLREAQARIDAMRVLYERLFRSKVQKIVSLRSYLEDLVRDIGEIFPVEDRVKITVEGEDLSLSPRQAVPVGIIVNELVSNALKYAFPGKRRGKVAVRLRGLEGKCRIELEDDGVGFAEARKSPDGVFRLTCGTVAEDSSLNQRMERKGFGLELVSVLVEQLAGTCRMESRAERGSSYLLEFTQEVLPGSGS